MLKIKLLSIFLLKCIIFSIVFGLIWNYCFRPSNFQTATHADATTKAQEEAYENQVREVMEQLAKSNEQQRRMDKLISSQEMQNVRYEAVLQHWEKQAKIRN